jgi:Lon protease-like protein
MAVGLVMWPLQLPSASKSVSRAGLQERPDIEPFLPLFPLPLVLFPGEDLPLHIFEPRYKEMIADCLHNKWEFGILLARAERVEHIGCTASITEVLRRYPDGRMDILVRGQRRFELSLINQEKSYLRGQAQFLDDAPAESSGESGVSEAKLREEAVALYGRLMRLLESEDPQEQPAPQDKPEIPDVNSPQLSFRIMSNLPADLTWKQRLLQLRTERERLGRVVDYLKQFIGYIEENSDRESPANRI